MRRALTWLLVLIVVIAAALLLGPRTPVDTRVTFDPTTIGPDAAAYAAASEARFAIRDGLAKEIVWADPATKARTPLAIVYVHGFSASKGETRPLSDEVTKALGANLFYTRLAGHGQDSAAMATGSVNAWVNDFAEAIAIGRMLGDKVVVIATSTGGALATWAVTDKALRDDIAALVLISPNYGVQAGGAWLLTMPWGRQMARLLIGPDRSFEARNAEHARLWTTRYPTEALLPMAALTSLGNGAPVETATTPALFIFSDKDQVVRSELTRAIAARWGAAHQVVSVETSGDPANHVIAGDALSPGTTEALARTILDWLRKTLP